MNAHASVSHTSKKRRHIAALTAAVFVGTSLTVGLGGVTAAHAASGDTFNPDNAAVFIGHGAPTQLGQATVNATGDGFGLDSVGDRAGISYNALGFNTVDNYLYALNQTSGNLRYLQRIDASGALENLGELVGLPTGNAFNQGTFGLGGHEGLYIVADMTAGNQLYVVDVSSLDVAEPSSVVTITLDANLPNLSDFAYLDGFLWGYDGAGDLYRVDLRVLSLADASTHSAAVTHFDVSALQLPDGAYGGQWFYGNGNLGITHNDTGNVYQIGIEGADTESPSFSVVSRAKGQATSNNDAASIFGLPADLEVTKTGDESAVPGSPYTYTITVTNNGGGLSTGSVLTDTLPSGLVSPTAGDGGTVDTGIATWVIGEIPAGQEVTRTVTGTVADDADSASLKNTVSVLGNEEDLDGENNVATFGPEVGSGPVIPGTMSIFGASCEAPRGFSESNENWRVATTKNGTQLVKEPVAAGWSDSEGKPPGSVTSGDLDANWTELWTPELSVNDYITDYEGMYGKTVQFNYFAQGADYGLYFSVVAEDGTIYWYVFTDQVEENAWSTITVPLDVTAEGWHTSFDNNSGPTGAAPSEGELRAALSDVSRFTVSFEGVNGPDQTWLDNFGTACDTVAPVAPPAPVIEKASVTKVAGTGKTDAIVTVRDSTGHEIGTAIVDAEGQWVITGKVPCGETLTATQRIGDGPESAVSAPFTTADCPVVPGEVDGEKSPEEELASTGADSLLGAAGGALLMLALGAALTLARRRQLS